MSDIVFKNKEIFCDYIEQTMIHYPISEEQISIIARLAGELQSVGVDVIARMKEYKEGSPYFRKSLNDKPILTSCYNKIKEFKSTPVKLIILDEWDEGEDK